MQTEELLRVLACPQCHGPLGALEGDGAVLGFSCDACNALYPVRDAIPILLVEDAQDLAQWRAAHPGARERA